MSLQVWLKQPLVDLAEITVRHDIVETFTSNPTLRESLRDQHLRGKPRITNLLRQFHCFFVAAWKKPEKETYRIPYIHKGFLCPASAFLIYAEVKLFDQQIERIQCFSQPAALIPLTPSTCDVTASRHSLVILLCACQQCFLLVQHIYLAGVVPL